MNISNITHVSRMNFTQRQMQARIQRPNEDSDQLFQPKSVDREKILNRFNDIMDKMNSIDLSMDVNEMTSEELKTKVDEIKSLRGRESEEMSDEEMIAFIEKFSNKREHLSAKLKSFEETGELPNRAVRRYENFEAVDFDREQFVDRLKSSEGMDFRDIINDYLENRVV